ncbi:hypothetical protein GA0074696_3711 [Micromonospora purpureochromogenes]|uniref:Serine/threonine protein kinase n=1 Tax=Micromonospora purpureochromogenes TaxID=47872 RepID=A0A1C4YUH4_9ACTN|nr:hypothetical protein [Micromonospora purpureochromogenes]SCF24348.1 hypothetical protein GA0074696_3711 [Micromonospora purpureochromogenes]
MKRITPLLTLLTGAGTAAVLFAMSAQAAPRTVQPTAAATPSASATAPPAAPSTPPADPTGQPPAQPSEQRGRPGAPTTAPAAPVTANWTGRLDGGATVAITATKGTAVAYVCDGRRLEIWLRGTAADGRLKLTGKKGATLTATIGDGDLAGELVVGDQRWTFTAKAGATPAPVLYRATAQTRRTGVDGGWIMLPDGSQIGVLTRDGSPAPAPPLDPAFGTTIVDGSTVTAEPVAGVPETAE